LIVVRDLAGRDVKDLMTDLAEPSKSPSAGGQDDVREIVRTIAYALLITLVLRIFLFQPYTIPSASMQPNLLEGDYLIVSKSSYGYSRHSIPFSPALFSGRVFGRVPQRGDVIVFKLPRDGRTDYVKRLVGLPGDRIQMKAGQLVLNGKAVSRHPLTPVTLDTGYGFSRPVARYAEVLPNGRSYVTYDLGPDGEGDDTPVVIVPEGHYFMLGDNRDNSLDSRFPLEIGVGMVPADNLVGKAKIVMMSWNKGASLAKPWTWIMNARSDRFLHMLK
jgi:signal peptidase I